MGLGGLHRAVGCWIVNQREEQLAMMTITITITITNSFKRTQILLEMIDSVRVDNGVVGSTLLIASCVRRDYCCISVLFPLIFYAFCGVHACRI
jgi:hypothetical protein